LTENSIALDFKSALLLTENCTALGTELTMLETELKLLWNGQTPDPTGLGSFKLLMMSV